MNERRHRRSDRTDEALRLLLETVRERSSVTSIALVDSSGTVVAGDGPKRELEVLAAVAAPAAGGALDAISEKLTTGTDVLSRAIVVDGQTIYLAALGEHVSRMPEAARSAARILGQAPRALASL